MTLTVPVPALDVGINPEYSQAKEKFPSKFSPVFFGGN